MHLTNYSLNKRSSKFKKNDDADADDQGSKWSLTGLWRCHNYVGRNYVGHNFVGHKWSLTGLWRCHSQNRNAELDKIHELLLLLLII